MTFTRHSAKSEEAAATLAKGRRQAAFLRGLKQPLLETMAARGLTVTKLADLLGVTKGTVSRALNPDNNVEAFTLFAMAEAMECEWVVSIRPRTNLPDPEDHRN